MSTVTKPIILDETGKAILAELRKFNSKNLQGPPGDPLTYDKLTLQQKRELAKPAADQVEALRQYIATLAASGDVDVALLQKVSSNAAAIDAILNDLDDRLYDAPHDGIAYARKDGEWVPVDEQSIDGLGLIDVDQNGFYVIDEDYNIGFGVAASGLIGVTHPNVPDISGLESRIQSLEQKLSNISFIIE